MSQPRRGVESLIHISSDRLDLDALAKPPEWVDDANCRGTDPEAFFPEKGGSTREAKAICARCTVQAECLDYGLTEKFGIFGGLSERDRRRITHTLRSAS